MLNGISVSNGVAIGKAYVLDRSKICVLKRDISPDETESETRRFRAAIQKSKDQIQKTKTQAGKIAGKYSIILDTYTLLLDDEILVHETIEKIHKDRVNAEWALTQTFEKFDALFQNMNDDYLKGKRDDLDLVVHRVLRNMMGYELESLVEIKEPVIIISHALSPSDTLLMAKSRILGMATEVGGRTSHIGIFASALGIPAVVGVKELTRSIQSGDTVVIDAIEGTVLANPDPDQTQHYGQKQQNYKRYENKLLEEADQPAITLDGRRVQLLANIESADELEISKKFGAEGIGLYRTEFLYLSENSNPTEELLFKNFRNVAEGMSRHPVVIRTLDIGGDKLLEEMEIDPEDNPALGLRGIRMSLAYPERFRVQLRAILRASAYGDIKVLYPMISSVEEILESNEILRKMQDELRQQNIPFAEHIPIGAMIETPAAARCVDQILEVVDFISIGTNDLIQYVLAVDRTNDHVAHLYEAFHPAILRFLKDIFETAHRSGKPVSICGELGGNPLATALLLGLGPIEELSMDPHSLPKVKKILRGLTTEECHSLAQRALNLTNVNAINHLISEEMRTKFPSDFDRNQVFAEKSN